jgi:hypothetical protein
MNLKTFKFSSIPVLIVGALFAALPGRVQGDDPLVTAQRTFASPTEAAQELVKAAKARDWPAMQAIFGPELTNLVTGDKTLDEKHCEEFASDLVERCDVVAEGHSTARLEIGHDPWPFPIPLIQTNGAWAFDTAAGEEEIVNRHIGRDEYYAIGVCRAYVKAQREYADRFASSGGTRTYAQRFKSSAGKMDGLYWPKETSVTPSPFSSFVAEACLEGYHWNIGKGPRPYHGYFFRILTRQGSAAPGGKMNYVRSGGMTGGFALVAYPVRWGESGIMTFMVNQDGLVYQKCLGEKTGKLAGAMKEYNPDSSWAAVQDEGITDLTADEPRDNAP